MVLFIKSSSQETSDRGKACEQPSTIQNPDRSYKVRSTKTKVEIKRVRPRIAEPPLHTHTHSLSLSLSLVIMYVDVSFKFRMITRKNLAYSRLHRGIELGSITYLQIQCISVAEMSPSRERWIVTRVFVFGHASMTVELMGHRCCECQRQQRIWLER